MFKLAKENLKMPVWTNNGKCYLKYNDKSMLLITELMYLMKFPKVKLNYLVLQKIRLTLLI